MAERRTGTPKFLLSLTLGDGRRSLQVEPDDQNEHGHKDATPTHTPNAAESRPHKRNRGSEHNPPPELQIL